MNSGPKNSRPTGDTRQSPEPGAEISLMFSGGVDSTVAAMELAKDHDRVHLLTYKNGYGHYAMGRSRKRFEELDARYPDKFTFTFRPIRDVFDHLVVKSVAEDYRKYESAFIWCMGCKLAMHTMSIIMNLERGVFRMSDGSAFDSDEMVEQMLISVSLIRLFYRDYGIEFETPVYRIPRDSKIERLDDMGFRKGIPIKDRAIGIQPSCIAGELYYLPYILFNRSPGHLEDVVARFIEDKKARAREFISDHFAARGVSLDELLESRQAILEGADEEV